MMNLSANTQRKNIYFGLNPRQIIDAAPNAELKKLTKWATGPHPEQAVEDGIKGLLDYAKRGQSQKHDVIKIFKNMIESKELQKESHRKNLFYGYEDMEDEYPGYIQAYQRLTGTRLNVSV